MKSVSRILVFSFATLVASLAYGESDERAMALLRGVENARRAVPCCSVQIVAEYTSIVGTRSGVFDVVFQGETRRFENLIAGTCVIRNEDALLHYDGKDSAVVRAPLNEIADYCFDPRVHGITPSYHIEDSIKGCLAYDTAKTVESLGQETVGSVPTSHVRVLDEYDQQLDFWIEETAGFRVHKYEFRTPGGRKTTSHAEYGPPQANKSLLCLPTRVRSETRNSDGQVVRSRLVTLMALKTCDSIPPERLQLEGLGMKLGTPVSDLRIKQRIGYWTGSGLSDTPPMSIPIEDPNLGSTDSSSRLGFGLFSTGVMLACVYLLRRKRKESIPLD